MDLDKIIVGISSLVGIVFTYWYFLMRKEDVTSVSDKIDIVVKGGYSPDTISIHNNKPVKISFIRKDPSTCLEEVILSDFKIKKYLPMNQKVTIEFTPQKKGEYTFSCGMNMFHGKVIVV